MAARPGKDDLATDALIRENLRLVLKIANEYLGRGLPWEDLVSEGNKGLVVAAGRFDPRRGAKFSTYSVWWIKQAIRQAIAEQVSAVRMPVVMRRRVSRIRSKESELTRFLRRTPTNEEIATACGLPLRSVRKLRPVRQAEFRSLEAGISDDPDAPQWIDVVSDETAPSPDELQIRIEDVDELLKLLATLPARERRILQLRFGLDGEPVRTLGEVGAAIGCTDERVRQLQNQALKKLQMRMAPEK